MNNTQRGGMIIGIFIGLVVGLLIAFGVVWFLNKTPLPFKDNKGVRDTSSERRDEAAAGELAKAPQTLPGKPGDKVTDKPRFEFYKILPGDQQATPRGAAPVPPAATDKVSDKTASPAPVAELLYLQVGAFQKEKDADNLKAKLSLLGLEVGVQEVSVPDKGAMHRVRAGPFGSLEEMNRVRTQLSTSGVQATLVKIKPQ